MTRWIGLVLHHMRYVALAFRRNPMAAFFGVFFPLMLLSIEGLVFGGNPIDINGEHTTVAASIVAAMSILAVMMTCFTNLAVTVLFDRDMGRLKRIRGTPTPVSSYVAARILFVMAMGMLTSSLCVAVGVFAFDVHVTAERLAEFFLIVAIGGASLAALSLAVVSLIRNAQGGQAVVTGISFPLLFLSNVFFPIDKLPGWINAVVGVLPVRPLAEAATQAFFGGGIGWARLAIVIGWGAAAALFASRNFRWLPLR